MACQTATCLFDRGVQDAQKKPGERLGGRTTAQADFFFKYRPVIPAPASSSGVVRSSLFLDQIKVVVLQMLFTQVHDPVCINITWSRMLPPLFVGTTNSRPAND